MVSVDSESEYELVLEEEEESSMAASDEEWHELIPLRCRPNWEVMFQKIAGAKPKKKCRPPQKLKASEKKAPALKIPIRIIRPVMLLQLAPSPKCRVKPVIKPTKKISA